MAGLCTPRPTLRLRPHGRRRTAWGRCGSLLLHRSGLAPPTPCRSPGALRSPPIAVLRPWRRKPPFDAARGLAEDRGRGVRVPEANRIFPEYTRYDNFPINGLARISLRSALAPSRRPLAEGIASDTVGEVAVTLRGRRT